MTVPHPFQYQGSKRALAPRILDYFPAKFRRLVEPFAGSAAISLACATRARAEHYWLNDLNRPLAELTRLMIERPDELTDEYASLWKAGAEDPTARFYAARRSFNETQNPALFLYLLARCVKGAVRYNSGGLFNQSPDKRRLGARPETMRRTMRRVSALLRGRAAVTSLDFRDVLASVENDDIVYMDPPYQGTSGERDSRYIAGLSFDDFAAALDGLNARGLRYAISYDGRTGGKAHGKTLPARLGLARVELQAGRSAQATLLGRGERTVESLYISPALASELGMPDAPPQAPRAQNTQPSQAIILSQ